MLKIHKKTILDKDNKPVAIQIPIDDFEQIEEMFDGLYLSNFNLNKKQLIDHVYQNCQPVPNSIADLGGIWNVDGAYTFYNLRRYGVDQAFIIDTDFTETFLQKSEPYKNLKLVNGNFGDESSAEKIGKVDAILLFDVLLHQVSPDWNEVLDMYSHRTKYFIIYNQQWVGSQETVRLLDLGKEEYIKNTPHTADQPNCKSVFEKMNEIHPKHQRIWKDIHNVWQWGITDKDLVEHMKDLGFSLVWNKNFGRFGSLPNFENHAFVFQKI